MNVGVVIPAYNRRGGLERVSVEYARGLHARGHDVSVFAQSAEREAADEGIAFRRIGGLRGQVAARALTFPLAATRAVSHVALDNLVAFGSAVTVPAVLRVPGCHRSWWEVATRAWPAWSADGLRRRLNPHHRIVLGWDRRILGGGVPSAVLAAGRWAADEIKRFYPAVAERVEVLPDGVNLEEFSFDEAGRKALRDEWDAGGRPILFILATELRRKGIGTLFAAFRQVLDEVPDAMLVVGGRVPPQHVRALAVRHRVSGSVRALGFVDDVRAAYSAADLLVFPTRFDPWGLPVVEALACGTRVAVSARAGAATVVRAGETGEVIENPADPVEVARAVVQALGMAEDREASRASVEHLSWDRVIAGLDEVLERTRA